MTGSVEIRTAPHLHIHRARACSYHTKCHGRFRGTLSKFNSAGKWDQREFFIEIREGGKRVFSYHTKKDLFFRRNDDSFQVQGLSVRSSRGWCVVYV